MQYNGNSAILTRIGAGDITLSASIQINQATLTIQKTITAYSPIYVGLSSYSNLEMLDNVGEYFKILPNNNNLWAYSGSLTVNGYATNYSWSQSGTSAFTSWSANGSTVNVYAKKPNTNLNLVCTASNPCYSESKTYHFTTFDMTIESIVLSSNPATTYTSVSVAEDASVSENTLSVSAASNSEKITIQLWNSYGLVKTVQTDQKEYKLNLNGVPAGFYYVHVIKKGKTYRKQLMVK